MCISYMVKDWNLVEKELCWTSGCICIYKTTNLLAAHSDIKLRYNISLSTSSYTQNTYTLSMHTYKNTHVIAKQHNYSCSMSQLLIILYIAMNFGLLVFLYSNHYMGERVSKPGNNNYY